VAHSIRVGIGGWTYDPWRGVFYPEGLTQKKELEFASRALSTIEINGTYYSTFKPDSWRKWRDETPEGFVFSVKASRYCTNRRELAGAGESVARFMAQGITELGERLGPICWQFAPTKKFDAGDFGGFLRLLPREKDGLALRHAMEVRNPTFATPEFYDLAASEKVAIVYAAGDDYPEIDEPTGDFTYARLMSTEEDVEAGVTDEQLAALVSKVRQWASRGDVFAYFISGAKERNPAAAMALAEAVGARG
jgi:uncharacterized protein YecE (DUF72 family)